MTNKETKKIQNNFETSAHSYSLLPSVISITAAS